MAPVLRPVVAFVVEVEVDVDVDAEVGVKAVLEVEVAIVEVELFELSAVVAVEPLLGLELEAVVSDCVELLVGGAELLEEEVVVPGSTTNPGDEIFDTPT
jgi:hypothetical protein